MTMSVTKFYAAMCIFDSLNFTGGSKHCYLPANVWQIPCCLFNPSQPGGRLGYTVLTTKLTVLLRPSNQLFLLPTSSLSLQTRRGAFSLQTYKGNQARGKKAACFCGFNISAGGGLFAQGGGRKFFFLPSTFGRLVSILHSGLEKRRGGRVFVRKAKTFGFSRPFSV